MRMLDNMEAVISIQHIAGIVNTTEVARLRRLIFRSTKGKSYMYIQQVESATDRNEERTAFVIVFWDGQIIRDKIQKICDSFVGQRYDLPPVDQIRG